MRRFLLSCICLLGVIAAFGQYESRLKRFSVNEVKGCAPFTVIITDTNLITNDQCTSLNSCLMDFEGTGTGSTNTFTHTYTTPGKYKLAILYQSLTPGADDIEIEVTENNDPTFEVYSCLGNQVAIKVTDKNHETYIIDFDADGTDDATIPVSNNAVAQFNYGTAGYPIGTTHNIQVRGKDSNAADNCKVLSESYTPITTMPQPNITSLTALDANSLKVGMVSQPQILYKLELAINNDSQFQYYEDIYEKTDTIVNSLLTDQNFYCFRLSAYDQCAASNNYSINICSHDFDVAYKNGVNELRWNTSPAGIASYDIIRNKTGFVLNYAGGSLGYDDTEYTCNDEYCYQIIARYPGGATSTSLEKCGIGILQTTFPPIDNITSVVRAGVELSWELNPLVDIRDIQAFDVYKSLPGGPLTPFKQTTAQLYIDDTYNYTGGTCYQINYHDACNNKSDPGIVACPMSLTGSLDDKNAVTLTWNSYNGYKDGVQTYQVSKYTKNGTLLGVYPTTDTTFVDYDPADDEQIVIYSITAQANEPGVLKSISNNITIEKPVLLILPNAFTPNGDSVNPVFTISGKFVSKISIQIFDKWGVLVYASENNEPWDGTKAGKPMPESAYVWKAEVEDFAGNTFTEQGTILLLRPAR